LVFFDPQLGVLGHLGALVPGQRPAQLFGQRGDRGGDRVTDRRPGAMPGQRRTVLDPGAIAAVHRRQMQQHREAAAALDQGADCGTAQPEDQVALPVPGNRTILGLARPLADHDLVRHEPLAATSSPGAGDAQRPPSPQTRRQLAPQRAAALHIERLIDRLMRDAHRLIIGVVQAQPVGDLLRAPRPRPAPILPAPVTTADPRHLRPVDHGPARALHDTG
jgi:hypothetical protein